MSCYTDGTELPEKPQSGEDTQSEVKTQSEVRTQGEAETQSEAEMQSEAKIRSETEMQSEAKIRSEAEIQSEAESSVDGGNEEGLDNKVIVQRGPEEEKEGLQFEWKDILALTIAVIQVIFSRVVIGIGSFALVIYLLGKFWLKCW